ncbi:hypothetical protein N7494_008708 [Penicillium frequentans]|uniref:Uncharacterized protein n=1 Tax=Penicillium frequentans TaxID=3151616 RepID=A0AAD6CR67_9EURO|nr:hypothetical protein N7494_008708 [Penicillium glabrum]
MLKCLACSEISHYASTVLVVPVEWGIPVTISTFAAVPNAKSAPSFMHNTQQEKLVKALSPVPEYALAPSRPALPHVEADSFVKNHHIRSSQHAMILCACPKLAQSNTQTMDLGASPYTASASPSAISVPIGLIMYTRKGWHTS